jgi:hypothetical protein
LAHQAIARAQAYIAQGYGDSVCQKFFALVLVILNGAAAERRIPAAYKEKFFAKLRMTNNSRLQGFWV